MFHVEQFLSFVLLWFGYKMAEGNLCYLWYSDLKNGIIIPANAFDRGIGDRKVFFVRYSESAEVDNTFNMP